MPGNPARSRVLDLLQADDAPALALALAAAAEIEPQRDITHVAEKLRRIAAARPLHGAAEAVQRDDGRAAFARPQVVRPMEDADELVAAEANVTFFHDVRGCYGSRRARRSIFKSVVRGRLSMTLNEAGIL